MKSTGRSLENLCAVILCSGISKRFGSNKLVADLHGRPVVWYVLSNVRKSGIDSVYIVTNSKNYGILESHLPKENYIINRNYKEGLSSSIVCAVDALKDKFNRILIRNGDQPFFKSSLIKNLVSIQDNNPRNIASASFKRYPRNPAIFPNEFYDQLLLLKGDAGARQVIVENMEKVSLLEIADEMYLFDIDTQYDYEKAQSLFMEYAEH